jgi:hypothetical protein
LPPLSSSASLLSECFTSGSASHGSPELLAATVAGFLAGDNEAAQQVQALALR